MNVWKNRGHTGRKLAGVALAVLILAVSLSVASWANCATKGVLYLTSCCSGGPAVCGLECESVALLGAAAGEAAAVEAGFETLGESSPSAQWSVDWYCGEHCCGPCRFAP